MDLLQNALKEALNSNSDQTIRWINYKEDHRQAIENMVRFRKSIDVNVMVPIGTKAIMPGKLYHTNEVFLSHSNSIYSKCTVDQALTVLEHRIHESDKRLNDLTTEKQMYMDKLNLPEIEEVFSKSTGEKEIIEEYNEEKEKLWREEHKKKIKLAKQIEREERENTKDDVLQMLDDLALREELENEIESLDIDDEMLIEKISPLEKINDGVKTNNTKNDSTDKPVQSNDTEEDENDEDEDDDDDDDEIDEEDYPAEFRHYKWEADSMPDEQKLIFYMKQLRNIQNYLVTNKSSTITECIEKVDKLFVADCLQIEIDRIYDHQTECQLKNRKSQIITFNNQDNVRSFDSDENPRKVSLTGSVQIESKSKSREDLSSSICYDENNRDTDRIEENTVDNSLVDEKNKLKSYILNVANMNVDEIVNQMNARSVNKIEKPTVVSKSILKNKDAVKKETIIPMAQIDVPNDPEPSLSKISKQNLNIIGDIIEKSEQVQSESQRNEHYENVQQPEKRISRFKASKKELQ